jgi:hypothetical protein
LVRSCAWQRSLEDFMKSDMQSFTMFDTWVKAAPAILEFVDKYERTGD